MIEKPAPGPWTFDEKTGQIKDRLGRVLATVHPSEGNYSAVSNGWLIAAAPNLVDACRYTLQTIKKLDYADPEDKEAMLNRARRTYMWPAIIKAEEGKE